MVKLGFFGSLTAIICALGIATSSADDAGKPCFRKTFKTELVKNACSKGGQDAARDAMKAWNKEKKIQNCNKCHTKLGPNYELKDDGLKQFLDAGGK
jgi:hypothetical protein